MAIYHFSMQVIKRSKGQSAVAAAAYRSGEKLLDEKTGELKVYKREVQPDTMILTPTNAPSWVKDREKLWNEVEKIEKRKDSQLAREMNIALPKELSNEQQKELIHSFVQNEFVDKGMIADIAIHRDDENNPHAHVMLTMRTIDEEGFGKKNRDWNAEFANSKENSRGFVKSSENCHEIREKWAEYANQALEKAQINERITHLSHKDRGLEILPTIHLGYVASAMEKDEKNKKQSDRGNINREIKEYNKLVYDLQKYREEIQRLKQQQVQEKPELQKQQAREKAIIPQQEQRVIQKQELTEREKAFGDKMYQLFQDRLQKNEKDKELSKQEQQVIQKPEPTVSVRDKAYAEFVDKFFQEHQERNTTEKATQKQEQQIKEKDLSSKKEQPTKEETLPQKQVQARSFLTFAEQQTIKDAEKGIGGEVTLSSIDHYRKELDAWSQQVEQRSAELEQQKKLLDHAEDQLKTVKRVEGLIDEQQAKIDRAGLFERRIKNSAREEIARHQSDLDFRSYHFNLTLKELGINRGSLDFELRKFENTYPQLQGNIISERQEIRKQHDTLDKAEHAIKQGKIREITSHYPELKTASKFMKYEDALKLNEINKLFGEVISLDDVKTKIHELKDHAEKAQDYLNTLTSRHNNSASAEIYFKELDTVEQKIEKIENNPFLKGKLIISKEFKIEFEQLKNEREQYKSTLQSLGFANKESFQKYKADNQRFNDKKHLIEERFNTAQRGLNLFEGAMKGIEEAQRREEREHQKQTQKQRYRGQKQREILELDR